MVFIGAIKNGATQASNFSSRYGLESAGCSGPLNPLLKANGLANIVKSSGFVLSAFIVAPKEAAVPPENSPFIALTLPLTPRAGLPNLSSAAF